jgi:hypothetical protein
MLKRFIVGNLTVTNSRDWFDLHFGDITYEKCVCTLWYFNSRVTTRYILVIAVFPIATRDSIICSAGSPDGKLRGKSFVYRLRYSVGIYIFWSHCTLCRSRVQ